MSKRPIVSKTTRPLGSRTVRKRRIEGLGEKPELEDDSLLQLDGDGVGLLHEDGVAPQVVAQGCELVTPPLGEAPGRQLVLAVGPAALDVEDRIYWKGRDVTLPDFKLWSFL